MDSRMGGQEHDALQQFAREHHVHYELEPEEVVGGEQRELVGVQVRLFAAPREDPELGTPGCPRCTELLGELRSFAERLVGSGDMARRTEIVVPPPVLYQSTEVPDADEVALTVRVHCNAPDEREPGAGTERCLGELQQRLHALGIPRH
jgi:hypothetical protein